MTFPIPDETALYAAESSLRDAADYVFMAARNGDPDSARNWSRALSNLQDALADLGIDMVPLKEQPPATAEALFDGWAYASGKGQL